MVTFLSQANVLARVKVMKKDIEDVKAMLANQPPE